MSDMQLDKGTVQAVEILADSTAKVVGTSSIAYLKLTHVVTTRSPAALDAARAAFDRLPSGGRADIRSAAVDLAEKMRSGSTTETALAVALRQVQSSVSSPPELVAR